MDNTPVIEEAVKDTTPDEGNNHPEYVTIKYNHEEKQIPWEEAVALTQKGMNYDKKLQEFEEIQGKLQEYEQKTTSTSEMVEFMNEFLQKNGYKSFEDYKKAIELDKLVKQNVPKEYAEDLISTKKTAQQTQKELSELKNKFSLNKEMEDFLKEFPDVGLELQKRKIEGKPTDDILPAEVMKMKKSLGISLTDAYVRYQYKEMAKNMKEDSEIQRQNEENANASTGSLSDKGGKESFFTKEQVLKMSRDEVLKNYDAIARSKKKWK